MAEKLVVMAPDPKRHGAALVDLVAKTFGRYFDFRERATKGYILNSHYDWTASRIGMVGEQIVSHFGVWDYQMRVGVARLRTGGIGTVSTHADYRKRGYMDITAKATIEAMREAGYDCSVLFGIWNFYHQFGYTRAWNETTYRCSRGELPKEAPSHKLRCFKMKPRADLAELYNRFYATATGTAVHPTFRQAQSGVSLTGYSWEHGNGKLAGYVSVRPDSGRLVVDEAVGDTEEVLRTVAWVARKLGKDEIVFGQLPHESDIARVLRAGTCTVETRRVKCGGAMIRTVNLRQTLTKMAPEFERRLKGSRMAGYRGELALENQEESALLKIKGGHVEVVGPGRGKNVLKGGAGVAQLLLGTDDPRDVVEREKIAVCGDAADLLEVLFPNQYPTLHEEDRF